MPFVPRNEPTDGPGDDRWYVVRRGELLVTDDGRVPSGASPVAVGAPDGTVTGEGVDATGQGVDVEPLFIGLLDGQRCWAIGVTGDLVSRPDTDLAWMPLMALGSTFTPDGWTAAGRAVQLVEWARTSRFCGRCGTRTRTAPGERAVRCPACSLLAYPRLAPAVIVLIRRGEEALLARNGRFRGRMFSTVAGFVEPGETLEEAVHREVAEEVGVALGRVDYVASQPWPFPHSLMLGFDADWASGEIEVDGEEIVEAAWFTRDSLPALPPPLSIARTLIDRWLRPDPARPGSDGSWTPVR